MKLEITLKVDVPHVDKISRVMGQIEFYSPSGTVLTVKHDGQVIQKTKREGNRWRAVK